MAGPGNLPRSAGPRNAKNAELCETLLLDQTTVPPAQGQHCSTLRYGIDLFCGMPDKHVGHKKKTCLVWLDFRSFARMMPALHRVSSLLWLPLLFSG